MIGVRRAVSPVAALARSGELPQGLPGFLWRTSGRHQIWLSALSAGVFLLSAVPLDLQRRLINGAVAFESIRSILWLGSAYVAVAFAEGGIKLIVNVYRGWVSETATRSLRRAVLDYAEAAANHPDLAKGVEVSMVLAEAEPIGGFIGISVSEPVLQGGVLVSVMAYLVAQQPLLALIGFVCFAPQFVLVPMLQGRINRRARRRVEVLRQVSVEILAACEDPVAGRSQQFDRLDRVFSLNMSIFRLKFTMNFVMNLLQHASIAVVLGVGCWFAVQGRTDIGTVVAFVSGLGKLVDPWGDLVNWYREYTVAEVKYRLLAGSLTALESARAGAA